MRTQFLRILLASGFAFIVIALARIGFENSAFRAMNSEGSAFVSFVSDFEDFSKSGYHDTFGWGGGEIVRAAARELGNHLHLCRQYKLADDGAMRFEVKVSVGVRKFRVVGILEGSEKNPRMAACLRDKINATVIEKLSELQPASEDTYRLKVEVQSNIAMALPSE